MKKLNFLLLAFMSLLPVFMHGQAVSQLSHAVLPDSVERTIIREYAYPATISYIETQGGHYFAYNDGIGALTMVRIDDSISVNDFRVDGTQVYFCGTNAWNQATVGMFSISNFFFVNQEYQYTNAILQGVSSQVTTLNRMATYLDGTTRKVVAIGQTAIGLYCAIETRIDFSGFIYNFRVGELAASYGQNLKDIAVTDNYVITAGIAYPGLYLPVIRVHEKSDIFSPTGVQDSMVYFDPDSVIYNYDNSQLVMTPIGLDFFLVAAFSRAYKPGHAHLPDDGTAYMAFYVPYTNRSAYHYISGWIQQQNYSNNWSLYGLTKPSSLLGMYFALQASDQYGAANPFSKFHELGYSSFISSSMSLYQESMQTHFFTTIDSYNSNTQYVASGYLKGDKTSLIFGIGQNPGQQGSSCMQSGIASGGTFTMTRRPIKYPFEVTVSQTIPFETHYGAAPDVYAVKIECESY